jgi:hypothetical protein
MGTKVCDYRLNKETADIVVWANINEQAVYT